MRTESVKPDQIIQICREYCTLTPNLLWALLHLLHSSLMLELLQFYFITRRTSFKRSKEIGIVLSGPRQPGAVIFFWGGTLNFDVILYISFFKAKICHKFSVQFAYKDFHLPTYVLILFPASLIHQFSYSLQLVLYFHSKYTHGFSTH